MIIYRYFIIFSIFIIFKVSKYNSEISIISKDSDSCDNDGNLQQILNQQKPLWKRYFDAMDTIYKTNNLQMNTCIPKHKSCGWMPTIALSQTLSSKQKSLPTLILSVGLEGSGHHLWTEVLQVPVFDCVWINARHYLRDIGDGVPRTNVALLRQGFSEMLQGRLDTNQPPCKTIYDAEDSFPTGAIRKSGRVFMRPDIVNLQKLDGELFNIKYLIIMRNTTDTILSALRRNFFTNLDTALRTVEHTLTYLESVLKNIPCNRIFIAHYEHLLADPEAYKYPLASFLELSKESLSVLESRLAKKGKFPSRKPHKLTQYSECKAFNLPEDKCYQKVRFTLNYLKL